MGQPNNLTANVKNNGPDDAVGVTVEFYRLFFGIAGQYSDWTPLGTTDSFNITMNTEVVSPNVTWSPPEAGQNATNLDLTINTTLPPKAGAVIDPPGPYNITASGNVSATLMVFLPPPPDLTRGTWYNVTVYGKYANGIVYGSFTVRIYVPVGGVMVPVNQIDLLAPFIGLTSAILGVTAAAAVFAKRVKRRKQT